MRLSKIIVFFLIAVFVSQSVYYYPNLPEKMASHFGASGRPDGWMSKQGYFAFMAFILALIIFEFAVLPWLIGKMPISLLNMPNKEYWFAEERRAETLNIIGRYFEWFSAALLTLFIGINQLVIRANLGGGSLSPQSWILLAAFFVFVIVWLVKFMRRFRVS